MRVKDFVMRLIHCLGLGKEKTARVAYKTDEIQKQREEAAEFRDEIRREADALIARLRAQARLRGGGHDDGHPRTSH